MAIVIHTRKGKYHYAYEHTRIGNKIVSKYLYPVNAEGGKIKQWQGEVTQRNEKKYYGTIVSTLGDKTIAPIETTTDHKPKIEYGGIGGFCKWHTSIKERDKYSAYMIKKGYKIDIKEYDEYYNKKEVIQQKPITIITKGMPKGYSIHKWSYIDNAGKQTVHALYFNDNPVFNQNKTFSTLPETRKALKEHVSTEKSKIQNKRDREYFKKYGNLRKTGYIKN